MFSFIQKVPRNVLLLGLVSFFNDVASEMIYPIVPIFLTTVLGAPVEVVGLIEGVAEGTASITKFLFGYYSDKSGKRKIFVTLGYGAGAVSKVLIGLAYSWPFVLFARFIDRVGKGLRTAPRDSLLLQQANEKNRGFIFGVHRAMDSAGAVVGPLLGLLFLYLFKENMRLTFLLAFIPAVIGLVLLVFLIHEKKQSTIANEKKKPFHFEWRKVHPNFLFFLAVTLLFSLGNSSDTFLILRATNLGLTTTLAVLVYVLYNVSQTVFATPAGQLADKIGARRVYAYGLIVFALVYFLFAIIHSPIWIWFLFFIYGIYIAATDGVSKAYISEFTKQDTSGTYFGLYQMGTAIAAVLASVIGGWLWTQFGPSTTFYFGTIMAMLAFVLLISGKIAKKV